MADTVILDVDGTLVDSNYQHALAWYEALLRFDVHVPVWTIHRAIGMGGDRLVADVAGVDVERRHGDAVRAAWGELVEPLLDHVSVLPGAVGLLVELRRRGLRTALASSGRPEHVDLFLDLLGARDLVDAWTTSADVDHSKPDPELLQVAWAKVGGGTAIVVGDSVWDGRAARRAGLPFEGLLSGGFSADELVTAGARGVHPTPQELTDALDEILG